MIDGGTVKKRRDFRTIVGETYKEFARNTSIHGLKYTVKTGIMLYERIFWIFVVLSCLSAAIYITLLFWNRYNSNPTRTSILTNYAPLTSVAFPAVSICNINRIMFDKVEDFITKLNIKEDQVEIVRRAFPQLVAFVEADTVAYNTSDLQILEKVLEKNDYTDVRLIMKKLVQNCDELLIKCRWNFQNVDCNKIFESSLTPNGHCCSFNYAPSTTKIVKDEIYNPFSGLTSGLILHLDPMIQPVQMSSLRSTGVKVIIHAPDDYPGTGSIYKIVSAGRQCYLQVAATKLICSKDVRRLSMAQRQCAFPDEVSLTYFREYSDHNCATECNEATTFHRCGCMPFYYPFKTDKPICNITSIPCLHTARQEVTNEDINHPEKPKLCDCISECEFTFYTVLSSTTSFGNHTTFHTASFLDGTNITEDSILLHIYFLGNTQTVLFRDTITSTIYLLSSFGGVYSLFLGCSFITLVEIVYYCSFRLIVNMKIVGRIDRMPAKRKEKKLDEHAENDAALHGNYKNSNTVHGYNNVFIN